MHATSIKTWARCLPLAWLLCANAAHAVCVSNSADLATALADARSAPMTIQLVQGYYNLRDSPWHNGAFALGGTQLLGGYTPGCAKRDIALGNTVLYDNGTNTYDDFVFPTGDLTIEGTTWQITLNIIAATGDSDNAVALPPGTNFTVRRNAFYYGGLDVVWGQDEDIGGTIRIVNNVLTSAGGASDCNLDIDVTGGGSPSVQVINNTLVDTSTVGACFDNGDSGGAAFELYNNIFWNNSVVDVSTDSSAIILVDNVVGSFNHPPLLIPDSGTYGGDPKLDANFRPIEAPLSPAINTGTNAGVPGGLPATDLGGRARIIGSAPDRGAYESAIDDSFVINVTTAADDGVGSLRAAIDSANGDNSFHIITFTIGQTCGPHVVTLQSALPAINASLLINGYTQPGSAENDLDIGDDAAICIVLRTNTGINNGLRVPASAPVNEQLIVEGLAFSGFAGAAISLRGGNGSTVEGVRIGGSASGYSLDPSNYGILVGSNAIFTTIGGGENRQRNVIGDALTDGIEIEASDVVHGTQVINNYIGVGWNVASGAFTNRGNGLYGVHVGGHDASVSGNVIGFNAQEGLVLWAFGDPDVDGNVISGNYIGISPLGGDIHNGADGVRLLAEPHDNTIEDNTIANNNGSGITVEGGAGNRLRGNSIHDNGYLGIDLGGDGPTANDNDSSSSISANRGQNFPVLTAATGGHRSGTASGSLTSTPGTYRIEFFSSYACDPSGNGEGQFVIGHKNVTIPGAPLISGQGTAAFTAPIDSLFLIVPGIVITATATDSSANTSEFSACQAYTDDTIFANGFEEGIL